MSGPKRKVILIILIIVISIIVIGAIYSVYIYNQAENIISESHKEVGRENEISGLREEKVDPVEDNVSVLFIGIDDSEFRKQSNDGGRSDALILATFHKENSSVKLLSIPRDTYVYVPGIGQYTKMNHAHGYGGARATIETVEQFLQVPVDYFVRMNFNAFVDVVDALGGISYNVPFEIVESNSADKKNTIHLYPGVQRLNGEEALALARTRKYDNDVERGKRQQEILKAIANQVISVGSVLKLEDLIAAVGSNMTTSLSFDDMKGFISYGLNKNISIDFINFEGFGGYMDDGLWYYQIKEESRLEIQRELREHLDLESDV